MKQWSATSTLFLQEICWNIVNGPTFKRKWSWCCRLRELCLNLSQRLSFGRNSISFHPNYSRLHTVYHKMTSHSPSECEKALEAEIMKMFQAVNPSTPKLLPSPLGGGGALNPSPSLQSISRIKVFPLKKSQLASEFPFPPLSEEVLS